MMVFQNKKGNIRLEFPDDAIVQMCPRCGMPNDIKDAYCVECGGILQGHSVKRLSVQDIIQCPECGRYNASQETVCGNHSCGHRFVPNQGKHKDVNGDIPTKYIKKCQECGFMNKPNLISCEQCGASLEFVDVEPDEQPCCSEYGDIMLLPSGPTICLEKGRVYTIGRAGEFAGNLATCEFVGREHAQIMWNGTSFVTTDNSLNGTYIDGIRMKKGVSSILSAGTVLVMGDPSPSEPKAAAFRLTLHVN